MVNRIVNPLKTSSFFLFGARGTGKSNFFRNYFPDDGASTALVEIKSTAQVDDRDARSLEKLAAFPWQQGLKEIGL
jgi:hypothetical protein